jgi:sarcosine oxidase
MPVTADVVVVGLGAVGSATLYQLARRGVRAVGIDRFAPPHDRGSSHGESRITRQAIGEGEQYVPFVLRSHEIWRALEAETGHALLFEIGGLFLGRERGRAEHHGQTDFIGRTVEAARRYGIVHEVLDAAEVQRRCPPFRLVGDELAYWEPGAGFLAPERCVEAQLAQARAFGAVVHFGEPAITIVPRASGVDVITDRDTYACGHVVVAAGAWLSALLGGPFPKLLQVSRQVLCWFETDTPAAFAPDRFPVFIWIYGGGPGDYFYGIPIVTNGVKLAGEQFSEATDPDRVRREVAPEEIAHVYRRHVHGRLAGVAERCVAAAACFYTTTPDSHFIVDRHPDTERVLIASPCSGHGFKHSAAIGEAIAERVTTGASRLDLSSFSLARFVP